jgi:formylglycine-generating enzyme required for sulfatase activity
MNRWIRPVVLLSLVAGFLCAAETPPAADALALRRQVLLNGYAKRELKQGLNPGTWVDSERWCVAHACLETGVRLDEANRYFSEVSFASLWYGLVMDTDVQVTDLLWTWFRFRDSDRLQPPARKHLLVLFKDWRVPNPDRNRAADREYEWPAEYTENHSLNILTAAYLMDVALDRDRTSHRDLLLQFLADRARWGWSEFHSPRYALVTVKALSNLVDVAPDKTVVDAARLHLDLLAIEFANTGLLNWRGLPAARGGGFETDNRRDAFFELARFWFGPAPGETLDANANPLLLHAVTSRYAPPAAALDLLGNPATRGRYTMTETVTTGPGKTRIPLVIWVSPVATMASAQGSGSYYDGVYWSISFASGPDRVITGRSGKGRCLFQQDNILITFGNVTWNGPLNKTTQGNVTIGGDGKAQAGQVDLSEECHLLLVSDTPVAADAFRRQLEQLQATFDQGTVRWRQPDGRAMRLRCRKNGDRWSFMEASANEGVFQLDRNLLYDSPWLRSVRDSGIAEARQGNEIVTYDFSNVARPEIRRRAGTGFSALPPAVTNGFAGIRLIHIPPGEFPMGSPATEGRRNERPLHWVNVPAFYISETEITVGQYQAFLKANPKATRPPDWYGQEWGKTDQHPMTWVSWEEARTFCQWLADTTGRKYRLPTEAEWEKAARGYSYRVYPWGDDYDGTQSGTPNGEYAPAGQHPLDVSPFGVRGMAGNAWEWCADQYDAAAYQTPPSPTRRASDGGQDRVLRGCGWNFDPDTFRCSYRSRLAPSERSVHIGFRVVMEP